jgi:hypothetical protein
MCEFPNFNNLVAEKPLRSCVAAKDAWIAAPWYVSFVIALQFLWM